MIPDGIFEKSIQLRLEEHGYTFSERRKSDFLKKVTTPCGKDLGYLHIYRVLELLRIEDKKQIK